MIYHRLDSDEDSKDKAILSTYHKILEIAPGLDKLAQKAVVNTLQTLVDLSVAVRF